MWTLKTTKPRSAFAAALALLLGLLLNATARAEHRRHFVLEGAAALLEGDPHSSAITEDGALILPPTTLVERYADAAAQFVAATRLGTGVLVAQANQTEILLLAANGQKKVFFQSPRAPITALLATADAVYVGLSTPAELIVLNHQGQQQQTHSLGAGFVWDLVAAAPQGKAPAVLYGALGEPGAVFRLAAGKIERAQIPSQQHIRSLFYHPAQGLLAGGGSRGVIYQAQGQASAGSSSPGKTALQFNALFDAGAEEITALLGDGQSIFAAASVGAGSLLAPKQPKAAKGKAPSSEIRSQLLRLGAPGEVEILAGSSDEIILALALQAPGEVLVGTGTVGRPEGRARLYQILPQQRKVAMIHQIDARYISHLLGPGAAGTGETLLALTAFGGRVLELSAKRPSEGVFYSQPFDADLQAQFGWLDAVGQFPSGTSVQVAVRTGQTQLPDGSWSPWSAPLAAQRGGRLAAAPGRFAQLRVVLRGSSNSSPRLQRVRLAYLRQNLPPLFREVNFGPRHAALLPLGGEGSEENLTKLISLADKGEGDDGKLARRAVAKLRARQVREPGAVAVRWLAEDLNGDELVYSLAYRPAEGGDYRPLASNLSEPFYTLRRAQLPDGYYFFKVTASDAPSNPPSLAKEASQESLALLIDNTAPQFSGLHAQVRGNTVKLSGQVTDAASMLQSLTVSLRGGPSQLVEPKDGLLDGPQEEIALQLANLDPGTYTANFEACDEADNCQTAAVHFTITAAVAAPPTP